MRKNKGTWKHMRTNKNKWKEMRKNKKKWTEMRKTRRTWKEMKKMRISFVFFFVSLFFLLLFFPFCFPFFSFFLFLFFFLFFFFVFLSGFAAWYNLHLVFNWENGSWDQKSFFFLFFLFVSFYSRRFATRPPARMVMVPGSDEVGPMLGPYDTLLGLSWAHMTQYLCSLSREKGAR